MTTTPPLPRRLLLENEEGLRRIARGLLRDEHLADDAVQETWVRALESPPRHVDAPLGWLRTVTRNVARNTLRGRARARRREQGAGNERVAPATDEAAAALERRHLLLGAVESLREPYRSTIVARYFDDLGPARIARRDGVPLATVKTRLRRGLALLRASLDARAQGDRRRWQAALLPLALSRQVPAAASASWGWAWAAAGLAAAVLVTVLLVRGVLPAEDAPGEPRVGAASLAEGPTLRGSARRGEDDVATPRTGELAAAASRPHGAHSLRLKGRVVDDHGRPVAGANVEVRSPFGDCARATTDAEGAYDLPYSRAGDVPSSMGVVTAVARDAEGRFGCREETLPEGGFGELVLDAIVLEPGVPLTVECRHRGRAVPGVRVLATTVVDAVFDQAVLADAVTDEAGQVLFGALPARDLGVVTWAEGYGRVAHELGHESSDGPVVLELPTEQPLELTLVVKETGAPLAGLRCELLERVEQPEATWGYRVRSLLPRLGPLVSDADGRIEVRGLRGDETLELEVRFPSESPVAPRADDVYGRERPFSWPRRAEDGVACVRLEFEAGAETCWELAAGDGPLPPDGTRVDLLAPRILADEVVHQGVIAGGALRFRAASRRRWLARLADGRLARVGTERRIVRTVRVDEEGRTVHASRQETRVLPVRFVRPRALDLVVLDEHGEPEDGAVLQLRMDAKDDWLYRSPFLRTDAAGRVHVEGLYPARYRIQRRSAPVWNAAAEPVAEADLVEGDASVRIVREAQAGIRLLVVGEDGPFVPPGLGLSVGAYDPWRVKLDGRRGAVSIRVPRSVFASGAPLTVTAPGYLPVVVPLEGRALEDVEPLAVRLERSASLEIRLVRSPLPPEEGEAAWTGGELALLRWDEAADAWTQVWSPWPEEGRGDPRISGVERLGARLWVVASLPPGTYRAADSESLALSPPARAFVGDEPGRLTLDLSGTRIVRGRAVPEGEDASQVALLLSAPALYDPPHGSPQEGTVGERPRCVAERIRLHVRSDGTYRRALPTVRGLRLEAEHPIRGRVELDVSSVRAGTEGVVDASWPAR